ncbi:MAG: rRNA large subunit methyltransferase I, partial [Oscillospiraceae bacterium]|nr:rRNA large subunit methyltransferase I [Oscillospiraceae bacterium]
MNIKRDFPKVTVTEKCRKRTAYGHPWIYDNEVVSTENPEDGDLADVVSEKGR